MRGSLPQSVEMSPENCEVGIDVDLNIVYAAIPPVRPRSAPPDEIWRRHVISGMAWSYSTSGGGGSLSGGTLLMWDGDEGPGQLVFALDLDNATVGVVNFDVPKRGTAGNALRIQLGAGGANVLGALNVLAHWIE